MKLVIEITTDGDAFGSNPLDAIEEIDRVLTRTSNKILSGMLEDYPEGFPIRDTNGNKCGDVTVIDGAL